MIKKLFAGVVVLFFVCAASLIWFVSRLAAPAVLPLGEAQAVAELRELTGRQDFAPENLQAAGRPQKNQMPALRVYRFKEDGSALAALTARLSLQERAVQDNACSVSDQGLRIGDWWSPMPAVSCHVGQVGPDYSRVWIRDGSVYLQIWTKR